VRLADDTRVRVPAALVNGHPTVEIGIRPEKIRVHTAGDTPPTGSNQLRGVIKDTSYVGVSTQYIVEARGGPQLTVYEQNIERATRAQLCAPGEEVVLTWSPDHSFVIREIAELDMNA
jgi:spermidine/putrescine transport system ATP-binding protein